MHIKLIRLIIVTVKATAAFSIALSLCGCIGMNSRFDCNVSSGGRCAPMNSINKVSDQETFNDNKKFNQKLIQNDGLAGNRSFYGYPIDSCVGKPIRSAETIQQIWIGPYEDTNGNYHEPAYLYAVVKKGKWVSEEKEVIQD